MIFPYFSNVFPPQKAYVAEVDHGEIRSGSQLSVPCALVFLEGAMRATVVFFFVGNDDCESWLLTGWWFGTWFL